MKTYLVGGAVRDILLGRTPADRDYLATGASRERLLARLPGLRAVGADVPSYVLGGGVEFALPRPAPAGAAEADPLLADLLARDLTVNALALADDGELIAHPRALEDLAAKILRPAAPDALEADPARVFRAARFAAQLPDFQVHPELLAAMRAAASQTAALPRERVAKETIKALAAPRPSRFLELLDEAGALTPWFSELAQSAHVPAGPAPYHAGSLLRHTGRVLDRLAARRPSGVPSGADAEEPGDPLLGWMGLCHDLGKAATSPADWPSHHNHDATGEPLAESLGERLGLSKAFVRAGMAAARLHMLAARYLALRPGTRVDLLDELHRLGLVERMFALVDADAPEAWPDGHPGAPDAAAMLAQAQADLLAMLAVRLPPEERDRGAASGRRLRELRCLALAGS